MTDLSLAIADLPEREQTLIWRSACHLVPDEAALPEMLRLHNHVTELDTVRLLHEIERGAVVVPRDDAWTDVAGTLRYKMPHLTRIVNECLRLRLLVRIAEQTGPDIWRTRLAAAPVHRHAIDHQPTCGRDFGMVRFRVSDDPALIDCPACLKVTDA